MPEPVTPLQHRIQSSFDRQGFMQFLGATLVHVREGYCEIHVPYRPELSQQHGYFHAGVISTLADNAAGYAAFSQMAETSSILTVEFKINLLAPADGEILVARASVLRHGRTLTVTRSDLFTVSGGAEKFCAVAQSTLIELHHRADTPSHSQ